MGKKLASKSTICTYCLHDFGPDEIWWVEIKMHRDESYDSDSTYGIPCCKKCLDKETPSGRILRIALEPKVKKVKKSPKGDEKN
jgi:hypothetical protein